MRTLLALLYVASLVLQIRGALILRNAGTVDAEETAPGSGLFQLNQDTSSGPKGTLWVAAGLIVATIASLAGLYLGELSLLLA